MMDHDAAERSACRSASHRYIVRLPSGSLCDKFVSTSSSSTRTAYIIYGERERERETLVCDLVLPLSSLAYLARLTTLFLIDPDKSVRRKKSSSSGGGGDGGGERRGTYYCFVNITHYMLCSAVTRFLIYK